MPLGPGASLYLSCSSLVLQEHTEDISSLFSLAQEYELCLSLESLGVQDPFTLRGRRRSVAIAKKLFSDSGQLLVEEALTIKDCLQKQGHLLLYGYDGDAKIVGHMVRVLERIGKDGSIQKLISKLHLPQGQRRSIALIKESLSIAPGAALTVRDVRVAVVAACLYPLRQNVGSCFATAPAILIQQEQLENMLYDICEMLTLGKIARTLEGMSISAPISPSFGEGSLQRLVNLDLLASLEKIPPSLALPLQNAGMFVSKDRLQALAREKKDITLSDLFRWLALQELNITEEELQRLRVEAGLSLERGKFDTIVIERPSKRQQKLIKAEALISDLKKSFLLMTEDPIARSWEYTLASFSEAARPFLAWHVTPCLGFDPKIDGGIGKVLYDFVEEKIKNSNAMLQKHHDEYQRSHDAVRYAEARLQRAESQDEARRLMAELQSSSYHRSACLDIRDKFYAKCSFYPELFSFFMNKLIELFPVYFQEIYDPSMLEVQSDAYDDSPAGFRLVYKHGREDPTLWTMIYSEKQFLKSLVDFFLVVEGQIFHAGEEKGCGEEVQAMVKAVLDHLHSKKFMDTAYSICKKNPSTLSALPWCFSSGGSLSSLIKVYYQMPVEPLEESFKVASADDLAIELIETLKSLPYNFEASFASLQDKKMLMHSPTHAFLLTPMQKTFYQAWDSRQFTYTWLRDHFLAPAKTFYQSIILSYDEQRFLIETFTLQHAKKKDAILIKDLTQKPRSPLAFFDAVVACLPYGIGPAFEAFLFEVLPLKSPERLSVELQELVEHVVELQTLQHVPYYTAKDLVDMACAHTLQKEGSMAFSSDKKKEILSKAEQKQFIAPSPLVFADSNWSLFDLGFVVSPATLKTFVWRLRPYAREGIGMYGWQGCLQPTSKQPWSLLTKPQQYALIHHKAL